MNPEINFERYSENFLKHSIGKWEGLVKFLNDIGFPTAQQTNYGRDIYNISARFEGGRRNISRVTIALKPEERQRRQSLTQNGRTLSLDEVKGQLENIGKWSNFELLVRDLIKLSSRPQA